MGQITMLSGELAPISVQIFPDYSFADAILACNIDFQVEIYYPSIYTFENTPVIYPNSDLTGTLNTGWYNLDGVTRQWNGQDTFEPLEPCTKTLYPINLAQNLGGDDQQACADANAGIPIVYPFWIDTTDFETATRIYIDNGGVVGNDFAPGGAYATPTFARIWTNQQTLSTGIFC